MANNCLVTKLKGVVDNDNLPIYGKVFASIDPVMIYNFDVQIGSVSGDIHLKTKVPCAVYPSTSYITTEVTIPQGQTRYLSFLNEQISSENKKDLIEFDNFYNCNMFYINGPSRGGINATPFSMIAKSESNQNLLSLYKYAPLEITSIAKEDVENNVDIADTVYYLISLSSRSGIDPTPTNFDKYLRLPNLEVLTGSAVNNDGRQYGFLYIDGTSNFNDSSLLYFNGFFKGNCANLPKNLKFIRGAWLAGNIEDFVSMAVSKGRTSGALVIRSIEYAEGVSYNGTTLAALASGGTIPTLDSDGICLTWNNGTISFVDTVPEGYYGDFSQLNPDQYYIMKHSS